MPGKPAGVFDAVGGFASSMPDEPKRVLAVDDDLEVREVLLDMFTALGHQAVCVASGGEAIAAFSTLRPHVIILDIELPDIPGTEVARQIRALPTDHPVTIAALTGWTRDGDERRSLAAGMNLHFVKPVGLYVLREVVGDATPPPVDDDGWAEGSSKWTRGA
jgi:two-component system CheB/CheR fusion protein